jgi:CSLREA domain-containing protein
MKKLLLSFIIITVSLFATFPQNPSDENELLVSAPVAAFVVNNNGDTNDANSSDNICADSFGNCTLRAAIQQANVTAGDDTITFSLATPATINVILTELVITSNITITGLGARNTIVNGTSGNTNQIQGLFYIISPANTVNISGITITNAPRCGITNDGGQLSLSEVTVKNNATGICNYSVLNLTRSTISNNTPGGGIYHGSGNASISNSTISNNTNQTGGGIQISSPSLTLNNVTISNNTATQSGGGLYYGGQGLGIFVRNTIIAKNTAPIGSDVFSRLGVNGVIFTSRGNNLVGISDNNTGFTNGVNGDKVGTSANPLDPLLDILKNNGGQTDTRALLAGSLAINAGNNCVTNLACSSNNPLIPLITDHVEQVFLEILNLRLILGLMNRLTLFHLLVPLIQTVEEQD